jgi:2-C-methyl-D-erythritol 4-phosphate cytidylyltransferase
MEILLTLPSDWRSFWQELAEEHHFTIPHTIVEGGKERYHSIKGALSRCKGELIAVHDGVRPLVDVETIGRCVSAAKLKGQAIPVVPVKDSLRESSSKGSRSVDRSNFFLVQTPQCFQREVLIAAYQRPYHPGITDDASLVEEHGHAICLVEGNVENIKITNPIDIITAEGILRHRKKDSPVSHI